MTRRQDPDVKTMTPGQLRHEVMKLRRKIRRHRDLDENARCWHCDLELYAVLPEEKPPGRMTGKARERLRDCIGYVCRQQCVDFGCGGKPAARRRLRSMVERALRAIENEY